MGVQLEYPLHELCLRPGCTGAIPLHLQGRPRLSYRNRHADWLFCPAHEHLCVGLRDDVVSGTWTWCENQALPGQVLCPDCRSLIEYAFVSRASQASLYGVALRKSPAKLAYESRNSAFNRVMGNHPRCQAYRKRRMPDGTIVPVGFSPMFYHPFSFLTYCRRSERMRASALCEVCCQYADCPDAIPNHPLAAFGVRLCKRDDGQSLGRLLVLPGGYYADYTPGLVEWQDKQRQRWEQEDSAWTTDPATGQPIIRPELAAQHQLDPNLMRRRELMGDQGARLVRPPRQGLPKVARMDSRDNVSVAEILAKKGSTVQDVIDRQRNWGMPFQQAVDMFNGFTMSLWSTAWKTRPSADEPYTWLGNTGLPIGVIRLRVLHALPAAFGLADLRLTKENLFKTDLTGLTIREDAATGTVTVQGIDALDESHPVRRAAIAHIIPTITHPSYQKKPSRRGIPVNFSSIEKPIVLVPGQPPLPRTEAAVVLSKEYAVTLTRQALNNHLRKGRSIEDLRAFCKAGCDPHFFAAKPLQFPDGTSTTYAEFGRRIGKGGLWGVGADPVPQAAPCGASASACGKTDASIP